MIRRLAALGTPLFLLSQTVAGQELRVRVTEPGRTAPVVGVLVRLEGDSGLVTQAITNDYARARLFAPAGAYRLVIERPGFADTTLSVTVPGTLDSLTISHGARRRWSRPFTNSLISAPPRM